MDLPVSIKISNRAPEITDLIKMLCNLYKKSGILRTKIEYECNKDDEKIIVEYLSRAKSWSESGFLSTIDREHNEFKKISKRLKHKICKLQSYGNMIETLKEQLDLLRIGKNNEKN